MIRFKSLAQNLNERDLLKLYRLEKDLSLEWVKYLTSICPDYAEIIIKNLQKDIEEEKQRAVNSGRLLVKKIEELKQCEKQKQKEIEKEIKNNEELIEVIKSAKEECTTEV